MEKEQQKKALMGIGGLSLLIGLCFLLWMIGTMVEFAGELEALKQQIQMYYPYSWEQAWNDPRVQRAISDGYTTLFTDKAVVFIPLIIVGLILIGAGKTTGVPRTEEELTELKSEKIETSPTNRPKLKLIMSPREREEALRDYPELTE
ncbi:MAG: hypothetical protein ACXABO_15585 [Promethearchaeota archaeon]|jgi:hypothetical protein